MLMGGLSAFFAQNARRNEVCEIVVSERFVDDQGRPVPWKIRCMTEAENERIKRDCPKDKRGYPDADSYAARLIVASVVYPDLKDTELQQSYGVVGADALLREMLLPGEYARLAQKVQEINGFDVAELVDRVKN